MFSIVATVPRNEKYTRIVLFCNHYIEFSSKYVQFILHFSNADLVEDTSDELDAYLVYARSSQ